MSSKPLSARNAPWDTVFEAMIRIDMHVHSTYSDGLSTPEALVRLSKRRGISLLSLTDHDTVAGISAFRRACKKWGVSGIAGTELSADADFTLHILGYRLDVNLHVLESRLQDVRNKRNERNRLMCEKLKSLGMNISMEELAKEAGGEVIARPHMARLLVKKGYVPDEITAFSWYLGRNGSAYVSRERLTPGECILLVKQAGGLAVLAHPGLMGISEKAQQKLVEELVEMGLWGIECYSGHHSEAQTRYWSEIASKYGLERTAGSDYHGGERAVDLGVVVPEDLLPWARLGVSL